MLYQGLQGIPVTLFDLDLLPAQRAWCRERGISLQQVPLEIPATVNGWQSWNKPLYLEASPYERTLWLDCDCVLRGSLLPLFEVLKEKPLILRHWDTAYPRLNDERLYERFPVKSRFATTRFINAGVLGIQKKRDLAAPWFRAWHGLVQNAASDTELRSWVSYWDEGALIWALEKTASVELVTDRQEWNRFLWTLEIENLPKLVSTLEAPTDDVIWHVAGYPKIWSNPPPQNFLLTENELLPFLFATYPQVWRMPEWSVDRRHTYWLFDVLTSGAIRTTLEIGCLHGATSMAFVEALNRGTLTHATFCDKEILPALRETVAHCKYPGSIRLFEGMSVDLLDKGGSYDLVFLDGDHRLPAVSAELERLLPMKPRCIVAHDTSATAAGFHDCEGPVYLKHRLQGLGWLCLEDAVPRFGERTHRGMFFATTDPELYEIARSAMASRCDVLTAHVPEHPYAHLHHLPPAPPPPPPPPELPVPVLVHTVPVRPTQWRQLVRDAKHVVDCKIRKRWPW